MESSHEQNFLNPKPSEDPIVRLSSSSSSSCSSIEAEPRPDYNNNNIDQSPPPQIMERTETTSVPNTPPYRIPSHVFARTTSTTPANWSSLSNESLFSIHMGNNSFNGGEYLGDLTFAPSPSPITHPLPSPPQNVNQGTVAEVKAPVDIAKKAAETDKAYRASKEDEQKAAASIREVIMANEAANKDNNNNNNKLDRTVSRRTENLSVKSFAFPVLGNADKDEKKQTMPSQPETPKIRTEVERDEGLKKEEPPKAEAERASNRNPKWLSCFPCCTTCV